MKKVAYISLFAAIVLSAVVGCSGGSAEEDKLGTAAAPPGADAVAEPIKSDKNRPGGRALGGAGGGAPATSNKGTLRERPAGQ